MRFYLLNNGKPAGDPSHPTSHLISASAPGAKWDESIATMNGCTVDDLKEQCRIVVIARNLGLPVTP